MCVRHMHPLFREFVDFLRVYAFYLPFFVSASIFPLVFLFVAFVFFFLVFMLLLELGRPVVTVLTFSPLYRGWMLRKFTVEGARFFSLNPLHLLIKNVTTAGLPDIRTLIGQWIMRPPGGTVAKKRFKISGIGGTESMYVCMYGHHI